MTEDKKPKRPVRSLVAVRAKTNGEGRRTAALDSEGKKQYVGIAAVWQPENGYPFWRWDRRLTREQLLEAFDNQEGFFFNEYESKEDKSDGNIPF